MGAPRIYLEVGLQGGSTLALPAAAARHVQVLRLQPGDALRLFNGQGGEWAAHVTAMGRSDVQVQVDAHVAVDREWRCRVTLALGMPANERMDALIEKATELGVAAIQPLLCERSVLRLAGDRATRRVAHWQSVAVAASEQSGRTQVPAVAGVMALADWLAARPPTADEGRWLLTLAPAEILGREAPALPARALLLSGPEGGLSAAEEALARARGFVPASLGPLVLRADTAPIAALARLAARS